MGGTQPHGDSLLKVFCGERKGLGRACACRHVYVRMGAGAHRWMRMDVGGRFVGQIRNFSACFLGKVPPNSQKSDFRVIFFTAKATLVTFLSHESSFRLRYRYRQMSSR